MSDNLMDLIKGAVSKEVMGKMGGILGQNPEKTSSAFEIAAGSILGGLIKKTGTSSGADEIFKAVGKQDDSVLDKLGDILGGGQATQDFEKSGEGILDLIVGGGTKGGILAALAKYLGFNEKMVGTLLSMAAPIVMGVIGRYVKNKALDAVGMGKFLGDQKQSLSGFMPSALTSQLGLGDVLGGAAGAVTGAAKGVGDAGRAAAGEAAIAGGSLLKMLIPLILIGVLGWLGYTYLLPQIQKGAKSATDAVGDLGNVDFGDFDMNGLSSQFTGITDGFKDVTADNANDLAGKVTGLTDSLGGMGLDKLTGPAKSAVETAFGGFTSSVTKSMGGIKNEGILGILKPVIDLLMEKIKSLGF